MSFCARCRRRPRALALALGAPAEQVDRYENELRDTRLEITGDDLVAAGLPESPAIGRALGDTLRRKLDGELAGREAELETRWSRAGRRLMFEVDLPRRGGRSPPARAASARAPTNRSISASSPEDDPACIAENREILRRRRREWHRSRSAMGLPGPRVEHEALGGGPGPGAYDRIGLGGPPLDEADGH